MNNLIILFGLSLILSALFYACCRVGADYDARHDVGEDGGEGLGGLHKSADTL